MLRVVLSSGDPATAQALAVALDGRQFRLLHCPSDRLAALLSRDPVDILVYDADQAGAHPREVVRSLRRLRPDLRIIILSGIPPEENVDLIEEGIFSYETKPAGKGLAEVVEAAGRALAERQGAPGGGRP